MNNLIVGAGMLGQRLSAALADLTRGTWALFDPIQHAGANARLGGKLGCRAGSPLDETIRVPIEDELQVAIPA